MKLIVITGFLVALFAVNAFAQGLEDRLTPLSLPEVEPTPIIEPTPIVPTTDANRNAVLVNELIAIHVLGDASLFSQKPDPSVFGVSIKSVPVDNTEPLRERLEGYIGQPLTLALLDTLNQEIVLWLRSQDMPMAEAITPSGQDITDGRLQIVALIARRGDLNVEDGRYFSSEDIRDQFRIEKGGFLQYSTLQEELVWANRNPFRRASLQLAAGQEIGFADLYFDIEDRFPFRFYTGVDDAGSRSTDPNRYLAGINWGNALGMGHQLGYQYAASASNSRLSAHSFTYTAPLSSRHIFSFYGSYVDSQPKIQEGFAIKGKNRELGFGYRIPLNNMWGLQPDIEFGYDFKHSNNNLRFGVEEVFDTTVDVSEFSIRSSMVRPDKNGRTNASIGIYVSPGEITSGNKNEAFEASRANTSARYEYLSLSLKRLTFLPKGWVWRIESTAQWSTERLLSSQQLGVGGYSSVRGYEPFAASGEHGIQLRNELLTHTLQPLSGFSFWPFSPDNMQGIAFVDYGYVKTHKPLPGEQTHSELLSVGLGVRYSIDSWLSGRLDYGWPLKTAPLATNRDPRAHFSLTLSY